MTVVDLDRAREMREQGMTLDAVATEFGVSRQRIFQLIPTPERKCAECGESHFKQKFCSRECARRASNRKQSQGDTCPNCGGNKSPRSVLCSECRHQQTDAEREERWSTIERLWAEGLSLKEVAARMNTTANSMGGEFVRMRAAGRDLPKRRQRVSLLEAPTKEKCRQRFSAALRSGQLRRCARCERCGTDEGKIEAHHFDYSKPLFVEWLCRRCHKSEHGAHLEAAA